MGLHSISTVIGNILQREREHTYIHIFSLSKKFKIANIYGVRVQCSNEAQIRKETWLKISTTTTSPDRHIKQRREKHYKFWWSHNTRVIYLSLVRWSIGWVLPKNGFRNALVTFNGLTSLFIISKLSRDLILISPKLLPGPRAKN